MLDGLGAWVGAIGRLLTLYLVLWERSERSRQIFEDSISVDNFLGATGRDAHMVWGVFSRELPMLFVIFFAPLLIGLVFLPPAVAILASIRPGRSYSPLRAAFVVIETAWAVNAYLQFKRGRLLVKVARFYQEEARDRWRSEQEWLRDQERKASERRQAESVGAEERNPDTTDPEGTS